MPKPLEAMAKSGETALRNAPDDEPLLPWWPNTKAWLYRLWP